MMSNLPTVSIIIPCLNEKEYITSVFENILEQDYPQNLLEVLIIDGMSEDGTRKIISSYTDRYSIFHVIDNPDRLIPQALNKGVKAASGDVILRMDAHSSYPINYVSKLIQYLENLDADNVGGLWKTCPANNSVKASAIALAQSTPFGVGNAYYRTGVDHVKEVDTVPFGCYRKEVFEKIGLFDEELLRAEDDEFNARLLQSGGRIYLVPDVEINYYTRDTLNKLWTTYYQYGYFKPLVNKKLGNPATIRQFVPLMFIISLILSLVLSGFFPIFRYVFGIIAGVYIGFNMTFSLQISLKKKNLKLLGWLMITFVILHFSYGWGYLNGIVYFWLLNQSPSNQNVKISR